MNVYLFYLTTLFSSILTFIICIVVFKPAARRLGLIDLPGGRKTHMQATPLIGGIAIFCGLCVNLVALPLPSYLYQGLLIGALLLLVVGIVDDLYNIKPKFRLIAQVIAALCPIFIGNETINHLGVIVLAHDLYLGPLSIPFSILFTVGFINAINMLDGQDGLAAGVVCSQLFLLFLISNYLQQTELSLLLFIFLLLACIFLCFNIRLPWRKHASIFLGDAGSTLIAFFVAWAATYLAQIDSNIIKPITLVWIIALPWVDLVSVCLIRIRGHRSCFAPSHDHIHHLLQQRNVSVTISTLFLTLLSFTTGIFGCILAWLRIAENIQFFMFIGYFLAYVIMTTLLNSYNNRSFRENDLQRA